jgi:AraC-like DNA-binding protein
MRMAVMMLPGAAAGLERSCGRDWVRIGASRPGFERVEVCFATQTFAPHRHDTYTIGVTLQGVQEFTYRGGAVHSLAGQAFVLHPDELHDGRPGEGGFRYRALYVEPHLIQEALEARSLPFLRSAVTDDARLRAAVVAALEDPDLAVGDLHFDQSFVQLAETLAMLDPSSRHQRRESPNACSANAAREFLEANFLTSVSSTTLERVSGLSRFALTRHFRACFGTSPHRYVIMRRLDRARDLIRTGTPLAEAASASGFADQAHMTRHFRKAYGVSPARWRAMLS